MTAANQSCHIVYRYARSWVCTRSMPWCLYTHAMDMRTCNVRHGHGHGHGIYTYCWSDCLCLEAILQFWPLVYLFPNQMKYPARPYVRSRSRSRSQSLWQYLDCNDSRIDTYRGTKVTLLIGSTKALRYKRAYVYVCVFVCVFVCVCACVCVCILHYVYVICVLCVRCLGNYFPCMCVCVLARAPCE